MSVLAGRRIYNSLNKAVTFNIEVSLSIEGLDYKFHTPVTRHKHIKF